jgi:branched-chain amino acid transport system permease protein
MRRATLSLGRGGARSAALVVVGALSLAAPFLFPSITTQIALLWAMVVFALTWDTTGGQMGYNSFGNVLFFGLGMYVCAVVQRDSGLGYFDALAAGIAAGAVFATAVGAVLGSGMLGLRGHYFAIGTLGLGIAAGEIASSWEYVGAGGGLTVPTYPGDIAFRTTFFYYLCLALAVATFLALRWLYGTRFGLALNAIRDDEDKAEAMGLHTTRYKTVAW